MSFLAPARLWLLLGVVALVAVYVLLQHRRREYAERFATSGLIDSVAPRRAGWRRHVAAGVAALALTALVLGLARPTRQERVPRTEGVVMLALDAIATSWSTDPGNDPPASIVLLSDGATTVGRPVGAAARAASDEGIPVSTIAFGTSTGTVRIEGQLIPVPIDAATMRSVADTTGGTFFETASASGLRKVYEDIQGHVGYTTEPREIAQTFVGVGVVALLAAAGLSLAWTGRFL